MKALLDTSVLVPALVAGHPNHASAAGCLRKTVERSGQLHVAAHSLAEAYAVLTRLPSRPRITGVVARRLLRENLSSAARAVALTARDYDAALGRMADLGLTGGAVYDALIVQAALKAGVDRLFTFNGADFARVWPEADDRLVILA